MPYLDPIKRAEYQKKYSKKHYEQNRSVYYERNKRYKEELKVFIKEIKDKPCMDCGVKYPSYVMDFDHRNPEEKILEIGSAVRMRYSKKTILAEIEKCDLVCSNCHRIRTYNRLRSSLMVEQPTLDRQVLSPTLSSAETQL